MDLGELEREVEYVPIENPVPQEIPSKVPEEKPMLPSPREPEKVPA